MSALTLPPALPSDRQEARRSFRLGVWNGALYQAGEGFIDSGTVIPVLLSRLTTSGALIGLGASFSELGWLVPQFLTTPWATRQPSQLPLYRRAAVIRALALLLLGALAYPLRGQPAFLLPVLLLCYGVYCAGAGVGGVAFMDVVGRTVPRERLGSFWSLRLFFGGALAALAGIVVREVMRLPDRGLQYVVLFGLAALFTSVSFALFSRIREPASSSAHAPASPLAHLADGWRWWRTDPLFRRLLLARGTLGCWLTVNPFVVLFALRHLGGGARVAGTFLSFRLAGFVLANLAWGALSKRLGIRTPLVIGVIGTGVVSLLAAVVAWLSPWAIGVLPREASVLTLEGLTFLGGAAQSGLLVGYGSLLLEFAPQGRRIEFVSLTNTFLAPTMLLPVLGGALADRIHEPAVFALCAGLSLVGLRAALQLPSARPAAGGSPAAAAALAGAPGAAPDRSAAGGR